MRKVKGVFRNEKWANKILFAVVVAVLVVLVGSWSSLAALLDVTNPVTNGYGYGYFENTDSQKDYGYHTYTYNPIKDSIGLRPNGTLIKTATASNVYWIDEGIKRWVESPVAFESWGFNWGSIITVTSAELAAYETGAPLLMRPGTLVKKFHDPRVYLFGFDDQLHWIASADVFNSLGLNWSDVQEITIIEFNLYTVGTDIPASDILAPGSIIKGSGPAAYLWEGSGSSISNYVLEWIRTPVAFESWNFNWASIVTINNVELNAYIAEGMMGSDIMAKPGTLIQGSGPAVYVVDNLALQEITPQASIVSATYHWKKRWITSETVFNAKGFLWSDIKSETDSEIAVYYDGADVE